MSIFHIEVHSRDRQIEHYIAPNCESKETAVNRIRQYYVDKGQRVGLWESESDRDNLGLPYLVFRVEELGGDPIVFIGGEYRPAYPI